MSEPADGWSMSPPTIPRLEVNIEEPRPRLSFSLAFKVSFAFNTAGSSLFGGSGGGGGGAGGGGILGAPPNPGNKLISITFYKVGMV